MPLYREGNFRRGAHPRSQGFVTMLPYRALVGPGIIQTKYPGFMCGLRLAPPDMESESVETKAHLCEYLAQLFSRLGDGWGTWLNVISRPAIGWPTGDGFTRPTMALIDEAQRRRFLDESANVAGLSTAEGGQAALERLAFRRHAGNAGVGPSLRRIPPADKRDNRGFVGMDGRRDTLR